MDMQKAPRVRGAFCVHALHIAPPVCTLRALLAE